MPAKKTPNSLKLIQGNYRPSRHGEINKRQECIYPEAPSYFDENLIQVWTETKTILEPHGYIDKVHAVYLEMYCKLLHESRTSENFTAAKLTQLRLISADLGCTPISFERMPRPSQDDTSNPFDGF
jgi:phage terminase small subunit